MLFIKASQYTRQITQLFTYATVNSSDYVANSRLNTQIQASKSWPEFYQIFKTNKESFTLQIFHISSKFINQILSREKENVIYNEMQQIISVIQKFDVQTMSQPTIISILALLRNFCNKGLDIQSLFKLKNKLCNRCNQLLINKPVGKENISQMIYAYYEMTYFGWHPGSRYLSQRIMNRISKQPLNFTILTLNQCSFLLNGLALKGDLTNYERKLRFYILNTLSNKLDLLNLHEVVLCLISINKMDFNDAASHQFRFVKNLGNKLLDNMSEVQQKSIFDFLKGDHINEHAVFYKIYQTLIKSTYKQIQQNGQSSFDQKTVIRLLSHLSSHYNFNMHTEIQKKKFSNFIKSTAKHYENVNDTQGIKLFHTNLQEMIRNRYFDPSKTQEIVQILSNSSIPVRFTLLEVLYNNKFDITGLLGNFFQIPISEKSTQGFNIKLSSFLRKVAKNPQYYAHVKRIQKYLQPANKKIQVIFQSQDQFASVFNYFFRNTELGINYKLFQETHDYFSKLTNPFEIDENSTSLFYKTVYLSYVCNAFRAKDYYKFIKDYSQNINNPTISKVVFNHINVDSRKIQPNKQLLSLVYKKLPKALEQMDRDLLNASLQLLNKYNRFVVCNNRDFDLAKYIIKIINHYLVNFNTIKDNDFGKIFLRILAKYITRNGGNYKNQQIYRGILTHSFKFMDQFPTSLNFQLIRQGLRLNLLNSKILESVDLTKITYLGTFEKQTLAYIQNNSHVPTINLINTKSLYTILNNHNLQTLVEQKQSEIIQVLEKAFINDRVAYLTIFNQHPNKSSIKLLSKILELANTRDLSIERCDFQGAMCNLFVKGYNHVVGARQFAQKVINLLSHKMNLFSLWTHIEAIRFANSIENYNPKEYYKKLVNYTGKNYSEIDMMELLYKLAFTNYEFSAQDLMFVQPLIKVNTYKGLYLFLATENLHSEEDRKLLISELLKRLSEGKQGQVRIQSFQYEYIKRAYPEETKDLNLKPEELQKSTYVLKARTKIINLLQKLAEHHQVNLELLQHLQQTYIYKIKNYCICFLSSKKQGSFHEQQFIKRALNLYYKDQGYTFIFSRSSRITKIPEYIEASAPQLITPEFKKQRAEIYSKQKQKVEEEEPEQKEQNVNIQA